MKKHLTSILSCIMICIFFDSNAQPGSISIELPKQPIQVRLVNADSISVRTREPSADTLQVKVINQSNEPIPVIGMDNPVLNAVQCSAVWTTGKYSNKTFADANIYTVPSGYRLAIEFVSVCGSLDFQDVRIITYLNSVLREHFMCVHPQSLSGSPGVVSQMTKIYADESTTVSLTLHSSTSPNSGIVTISGYLVPINEGG